MLVILPFSSFRNSFLFQKDNSGAKSLRGALSGGLVPGMELAVLAGCHAFDLAKRLVEVRLGGESHTESDGQDRSRRLVPQHGLGGADALLAQVAGESLAQAGVHQFR